MGKGQKSSSNQSYVSAGTHSNVAKSTLRAMRASKTEAEKLLNKQKAWVKGQNPWLTIENPNREETNKPFIKVRMNDLMKGSHKDIKKAMYIVK
jgi:hypothetical protein